KALFLRSRTSSCIFAEGNIFLFFLFSSFRSVLFGRPLCQLSFGVFVIQSLTMSVKKLCSQVIKQTNLSFIRRKYFSSSKQIFNTHLPNQVQHTQYSQALGSLTKDQAHDLVFRLNDEERTLLMKTLEQFNVKLEKDGLTSQLASSKWRSRFGRPTKIDPNLGEVVGGVYCKMPEDWLQNKIAAATPPPKTNDLLKLCLINSLPFVGFGFLDNFTMIIAGDYIEHSLGLIMTISTMAAAALGNTISDVLGIGSAVYVERFVEIIGVKAPDLSPIQLEMKSARRASNMGRVLGITVGCLLGMLPLIFMKHEKSEKDVEKDKKDAKKENTSAPSPQVK
ncbi:CLUMA_CG005014, isoform A, partial [Clunio marinus]